MHRLPMPTSCEIHGWQWCLMIAQWRKAYGEGSRP